MQLLRLKVVLAASDDDDTSLVILEAARMLADAAGAMLHVVHVAPPGTVTEGLPEEGGGPSDVLSAMLDRAKLRLDRSRVHVVAGEPALVIRTLADRVRADVIVLGPHREGRAPERQLGGTALAIATASWAPCLIVKRGIRLPLERVLVPVDLSGTARGALMVALSWSSALRAGLSGSGAETTVTAMYVERAAAAAGAVERGESTSSALAAELSRVRRQAGAWAGVNIEGVTIAGSDVVGAIADRARDGGADLVVLGTRGQGLDKIGRLGSVSEAVIRRLDVPALLVPPAVWAAFLDHEG